MDRSAHRRDRPRPRGGRLRRRAAMLVRARGRARRHHRGRGAVGRDASWPAARRTPARPSSRSCPTPASAICPPRCLQNKRGMTDVPCTVPIIQEAAAAQVADRTERRSRRPPVRRRKLRLPNRHGGYPAHQARSSKLMFPAYFGDPELHEALPPADYSALHSSSAWRRQAAARRSPSPCPRARRAPRRRGLPARSSSVMPYIQEMLLKDLDANVRRRPRRRVSRRRSSSAYPGSVRHFRLPHRARAVSARRCRMIPRIMTRVCPQPRPASTSTPARPDRRVLLHRPRHRHRRRRDDGHRRPRQALSGRDARRARPPRTGAQARDPASATRPSATT